MSKVEKSAIKIKFILLQNKITDRASSVTFEYFQQIRFNSNSYKDPWVWISFRT